MTKNFHAQGVAIFLWEGKWYVQQLDERFVAKDEGIGPFTSFEEAHMQMAMQFGIWVKSPEEVDVTS